VHKFDIWRDRSRRSKVPRRGILRYYIEASRIFIARFETIDSGYQFRTCIFSDDALHLRAMQIIFQRIHIKEASRRTREPVARFSRDEGE